MPGVMAMYYSTDKSIKRKLICNCFVFYQAKMSNINWFRLLKFDDFLLFFSFMTLKEKSLGFVLSFWSLGNCDMSISHNILTFYRLNNSSN